MKPKEVMLLRWSDEGEPEETPNMLGYAYLGFLQPSTDETDWLTYFSYNSDGNEIMKVIEEHEQVC